MGLVALASATAAQSFSTISFESFDYPVGTGMHNAAGGTGWANAWWAGDPPTFSLQDHSVTVAPSLDGVGNTVEESFGGFGSFRFPSSAGFEHILDYSLDPAGLFGADDTTIWLSFYSRRMPGGDDQYGGISLNHQFVNEYLFLGAPNSWNLWGVHDAPWGANVVTTVAGSNVDQTTHLVYRIDFLLGQERLRLWMDPALAHPDTPADMDVMIQDFRFNEIGYKSGNEITTHGWQFDGILIETPTGGAGLAYCFGDGLTGVLCPCANSSTGGEGCGNSQGRGALLTASGAASIGSDSLVLHASGLVPMQPGLYFQGNNAVGAGAGAVFGDGLRCAGGTVIRLQVSVADTAGESMTTNAISTTAGLVAGDLKRYQIWYRDPAASPCGSGFNLSNGIEVNWTP
jgi:hypothetical protein